MASHGQQHFTPFFSPSQISAKTIFWGLGTTLFMLGALWVCWTASLSIVLTLASLLIAIAIDHAVQWLVLHRWRRGYAIAAAMSTLVLLLLAFALAFIPSAIRQGTALISQLPDLTDHLRSSHAYAVLNKRLNLDANLAHLAEPWENTTHLAHELVTVLGNALLVMGAGLTVFFLALFMLVFGPALVRRVLDETRRTRRPYYERIFRRIYTSLGGYIGGLALISALIAAATSLFLAVLRVPYFLALGLVCGLLNLVPNIGPAVAVALLALFTFIAGGLWKMIALTAFFLVYKQIENQIVGPLIFKRTASVNPLLGTIVILFMTEIAGIPGALLSIPMLACVQVILGEVLAIRREWLQREVPEDAPAHRPRR